MKIVFFNYLMLECGGGVAKYMIETAAGLKERYRDVEITHVTFDEKLLKKILFLYSIYYVGKQDMFVNKRESLKDLHAKMGGAKYLKASTLAELKDILKQHDVVYSSNNFLEAFLLTYILGIETLPPIVYGFHIPVYYRMKSTAQSYLHNILYASFLYKKCLDKAAALHVTNSFDTKYVSQLAPQTKIKHIPYAFDFDAYAKISKVLQSYTISTKDFNIMWVGRLTEQKGVHDLISMIDELNATSLEKSIKWYIAGEGEFRSDILRLERRCKNVKYLGYVANTELSDLFSKADLFISTSKWESFPYVLLEAQSHGVPVIAYKIQGCSDIIDDGINGRLVEKRGEYASIIMNLLKNNIDKSKIKKYIRKKFDTEDLFKQMYLLLKQSMRSSL